MLDLHPQCDDSIYNDLMEPVFNIRPEHEILPDFAPMELELKDISDTELVSLNTPSSSSTYSSHNTEPEIDDFDKDVRVRIIY